MALHLITGYAGQEHITSADQGAYNMGTFGEGEFVLDRGSKFAATVVTNNQITIADGEALMQGRFIKLPVGTTESVTIDNGTSDMKRKDLIVLRYSKDAGTGIESVALAVKKGTPSSGTPSDPAVTTGTITDGTDLVNEMPLYRVNLDGLNIASLDTLYSLKTTMVEYMDEYQLPVADADTLGGVKIGTNITRASDGKISIPNGSTSAKGVLKVGSGLSVSSGIVSVPDGTSSTKGILKVGSGLSVSSGTVSVPDGSTSTKGILKVGSGIDVSSGTISVPTASSSVKGLVKIDSNDAYGLHMTGDYLRSDVSNYNVKLELNSTFTAPVGWSRKDLESKLSGVIPDGVTIFTFIMTNASNNDVGIGFLAYDKWAMVYNSTTSSQTIKYLYVSGIRYRY